MPGITYYLPNGNVRKVELTTPGRVMQTALENDVPGIIGECGGQAMCASCHVYVHDEYVEQLPGISDEEEEMLEVTAEERDPRRSRLGCQLEVGNGVERLEVDVPERQI